MKRVVNFYRGLPRGPAPEIAPTGLFGRYQAKHFGKNPTGKRTSDTFDYSTLLFYWRPGGGGAEGGGGEGGILYANI